MPHTDQNALPTSGGGALGGLLTPATGAVQPVTPPQAAAEPSLADVPRLAPAESTVVAPQGADALQPLSGDTTGPFGADVGELEGRPPPPPAQLGGTPLAAVWDALRAKKRQGAVKPRGAPQPEPADYGADMVVRAAGRGVLKAADQFSNAVVGLGAGITKRTGLYKIGQSEADEKQFLDWWSQRTADANPFQFGEERIARWLGPEKGGLASVVEGVTQFATGLALLRRVPLGPAAEAIGTIASRVPAVAKAAEAAKAVSNAIPVGPTARAFAGKVAKEAVEGGAVMATFFDPYAKKLANSIEEMAPSLRGPILDFLAVDADDSEAEARFKSGIEGVLTDGLGATLFSGVKYLKALRRGDTAAAEAAAVEAVTGPAAGTVGPLETRDIVTVAPAADGNGFAVVPTKADAVQPLATPAAEAATPAAGTADAAEAVDPPVFANEADATTAAVSINYADRYGEAGDVAVTPEMAGQFRERVKLLKGEADPRTTAELLRTTGINFKYVYQPEELVAHVKALADIIPEPIAAARNAPVPWAETVKAAADLIPGMSGEEAAAAAGRLLGVTDKLTAQIVALKSAFWEQGKHIQKLAALADANPDNPIPIDELRRALDSLARFHADLVGTSSNIGRALNIHKLPTDQLPAVEAGAAKETAETAAQGAAGADAMKPLEPRAVAPTEGDVAPTSGSVLTDGRTPDEIRATLRQLGASDGNPKEVLDLIQGAPKQQAITFAGRAQGRRGSAFLRYRMQAMLSSPLTSTTAIVSGLLTAAGRPVGDALYGVFSLNPARARLAADYTIGAWKHFGEAMSWAGRAFMQGGNILREGATTTETTLGAWDTASFGAKIFDFPARFLMTVDEGIQQVSYRADRRAQILRQAREAGITDPAALAERLESGMAVSVTKTGQATDPTALRTALENSLTRPLNEGGYANSLGSKIQGVVRDHWYAQLVQPFITAPVNAFRYTWEMTPIINLLNKQFRADLAAGGEARARAIAKANFGGAVWALGSILSAAGFITGGGPTDPVKRQELLDAGWRPYSGRIPGTNEWISYRRLDPVFTPFGIISDVHSRLDELGQKDKGDIAYAVMAAVAANVTNKTFLRGIVSFMDAISNGQTGSSERFAQTLGTSYIPNALSWANPDNTFREVQGVWDAIQAKLPGTSGRLEPRRNVFGEPVTKDMWTPRGIANKVNPAAVQHGADPNDAAVIMALLDPPIGFPAKTRANGWIRLTDQKRYDNGSGQSPYDWMMSRIAEPGGPDGLTLRQRLDKLFAGTDYNAWPVERQQMVVTRLVSAAQTRAWAETLRQYPKLAAEFRAFQRDPNFFTGPGGTTQQPQAAPLGATSADLARLVKLVQ